MEPRKSSGSNENRMLIPSVMYPIRPEETIDAQKTLCFGGFAAFPQHISGVYSLDYRSAGFSISPR
jgi:hypothetical protein